MTLNVIDLVDGNAYEPGADGYILKAGQGQLEYNWKQYIPMIEAEKKVWGVYWLCDARYSPESHKAAIKDTFPDGKFGALGLWLDIEKPILGMTDAQYQKLPYTHYKPIESIWRGVQAYSGVYPGMYFGPGSWDLIMWAIPISLQAEFASKCRAWIAHYDVEIPSMRGLWPYWSLWQWREGPDYNRVNDYWWDTVVKPLPPTKPPIPTDGVKLKSFQIIVTVDGVDYELKG